MVVPKVSVILPVYNGERFLREAIESILGQTFQNLELIIINDGSKDGSEKIIKAYSDPRILYLVNQPNKGLIYTLNRGIEMASGHFIARMDADDIALPHRLERQVEYLGQNPGVAVVACPVQYIDEHGEFSGSWVLDHAIIDRNAIRNILPSKNVIAHPTVMARSEVMKAYLYAAYQPNTEDYDLWLRIAANGLGIAKIQEVLLHYRIHSQSVTSTALKGKNIFLKNAGCKWRFLKHQLAKGKINGFIIKVAFYSLIDLLTGIWKSIVGK
ncbi:glycosyltransferase [Flavihumibacter rivuli]|uniref:glycosyltransferase n=1 Tax=Flavihumibacter rivuli TaxID=2838156 RepID=UPI001BDF130E|nr:glycosyltransferase [Flavihumibacter rivuli]ULQ57426.1 glycosyltransferase [Flavihumibacter rivuli]